MSHDPRKLIFKAGSSAEEVLALSAVIRDLHCGAPGTFETDVRSFHRDLWENNPHLTNLNDGGEDVETIDCAFHELDLDPAHPSHQIVQYFDRISSVLGVPLKLLRMQGDVHISALEKTWISQVEEITSQSTPFWIIQTGTEDALSTCHWNHWKFQQVVDHFHGKIRFVQISEPGTRSPSLKHVVDLRSRTDLRQLVRLVYHAEGMLSTSGLLPHLSAAIESKHRPGIQRPCLVIAGGHLPLHWNAYPGQQYFHSAGMLPCCAYEACRISRMIAPGAQLEGFHDADGCPNHVDGVPVCMDLISAEEVIRCLNRFTDATSRNVTVPSIAPAAPRFPFLKATNPTIQTPAIRNALEIRVVGLRRSGLHAILNWIAGLYSGPICFLNDITGCGSITEKMPSAHLPSVAPSRYVPVGAPKQLLLYNYEDCSLAAARRLDAPRPILGESKSRRDVVILRDPYNTLASRTQLLRAKSGNSWADALAFGDPSGIKMAALWNELAREYLMVANNPDDETLVVNFNKWFSDSAYRHKLADALMASGDPNLNREAVAPFGFGSSFDELRMDGAASKMRVLERWKACLDDALFRSALQSSEELHRHAWIIFGDVFGECGPPDWLSALTVAARNERLDYKPSPSYRALGPEQQL